MHDLDQWWAAGSRASLRIDGEDRAVFYRVEGTGRWLTLLHGFPSSSWDWSAVWPALTARFRVIALDFLGYGQSDKSASIPYSTALHADTVEALWQSLGVRTSFVVGHDIGTAVTQELLARRADDARATAIAGAILMNGAVITDSYRPTLVQRLMMSRITGPWIARSMNERRFERTLRRAFAPDRQPDPGECASFWRAMHERDGHRAIHRLMHHIPERVRLKARWEGALASPGVRYVWGTRDPFVGYVAGDVRRRFPAAEFVELRDVGHFPQVEAPDAVVAAVARWADRGHTRR
jgi:pimeloyl-ACP methyl ester carboxylesterase